MQFKESYKTEANDNENSNQSFNLDCLTIPLARKLAVVVFMDSMSYLGQMEGIKTGSELYYHGNIILNDSLQSHIVSDRSLSTHESKILNHTNFNASSEILSYAGNSLRSWCLQPWRSFTILLSNTWKRLFPLIFNS